MSQASNASSFVLNFINSKPKHNDSASRKGLKNPKPQLRMLSSSDSSSDENDENNKDQEPAWKRKLARRLSNKENNQSPNVQAEKSSSQKIRLALESGSEDDNEMHNSSNESSKGTTSATIPDSFTFQHKRYQNELKSSSLNTTAVSKVSANISGNRTASSTTPTMLASVARLTPHSNTVVSLRVTASQSAFQMAVLMALTLEWAIQKCRKGRQQQSTSASSLPTTWKEQTPATSKSNLQKSRSLSHSVIHKPRKTQSTGSSGHRRLSRGSSEEPCSPGKKRKIAKAKLVKNEDDPRIQRLKKYINAAGLRPKYEELLQNSSSDDHIVKLLEEYLVKKGIQKPFGMDKCLQYKADQDFKREVMSLEILNPTLKSQVKDSSAEKSEEKTRICCRKGGSPEVVTLDSTSEEDEDEEEESDSEDEGPRGPKQVFASLADIVSSEGSEGDSD
uniref:Uncharacterized protein n=1 Tax=Ditylenchus dipsaci TaxID=166011 RepID=A0A915CN67_9BILA